GSASLDAERYGRALTDNFDTIPWHIIYAMFLIPDWMPYPHRRRAMQSRDFLHRDIRRIVESRRSIQCSQPDLLDLLLTARDHETGRSMSDNEIVTNLPSSSRAMKQPQSHLLGRSGSWPRTRPRSNVCLKKLRQ